MTVLFKTKLFSLLFSCVWTKEGFCLLSVFATSQFFFFFFCFFFFCFVFFVFCFAQVSFFFFFFFVFFFSFMFFVFCFLFCPSVLGNHCKQTYNESRERKGNVCATNCAMFQNSPFDYEYIEVRNGNTCFRTNIASENTSEFVT